MPKQKQKQSMQQEYQPDKNLSKKENTLLERLHNNDETLEKIDLRDYEWNFDRIDSYNKFKKELFKALETNTTVKHLIFSEEMHNHDQLAKVFEKNSTITHVDLSSCYIDRNGGDLEKLAWALGWNKNTKITHLNLSFNEIDKQSKKGLKQLGKTLESNSTITHLDLKGNNDLGRRPYEENGIEDFLNGLAKNSKITHLDLSGTYFGYYGDELARLFKNNSTMEDINLASTWMEADQAIKIFDGLAENKRIKSIDLSGNYILRSEKAMEALANVLEKNKTIMNLNLHRTGSRNGSLKIFAEALSYNTCLKNLNLEFCKCGDEGAIALADALKQNSTLTHLNLRHNQIGPTGAIALADALKENSTLTHLNLGLNEFRELGIIFLAYALITNNTIQELDLERNIQFSEEMVKSLENFLKLNNIDSRVKNLNELYYGFYDDDIHKLEILKKFFLLVMIPRTMDPVTDILYSNLSLMDKSTLTRNLVATTKDRQTEFSQVQNDATQIYNKIHQTNNYFPFDFDVNNTKITFDVKKRETVNKKEKEIWCKFKEYLSMTKQQVTFDTDIPHKLFLEFLELYFDNGIIEFKKNFFIGKEDVLRNLRLIVAIDYINVLHRLLPVAEIEKLIKNLFQEEQKQITQKQITQKQRTQKQTSTSSTEQKKTQRPYYKKLEKKLFELHYEKIIDTIIQSNKKKIVNIQKQIQTKKNQITELEKSKGNQTEKQITQKQDQNFDIKIRRRKISNIMTNNQRMDKLKKIKNNEMDVIKSQSQNQSQTQQMQRKILDNMLPETFQLKFSTTRKRKFQQNTPGQKQQLKNKKSKTKQGQTQRGQKQSNKKTKQKIIFQRVGHSTRGPVIKYTDPQSGNQILHTISEEELQSKMEAGEYQQQI